MQKKFSVVLILVLVLSVIVTACKTSENNEPVAGGSASQPASGASQGASVSPSGTEAPKPVTLKIWIHEGYVNHVNQWGMDPVSKYIQEKTGVKLEISTGDGANDDTKLNLMISSGDMPDMLIVPKLLPGSFKLQSEEVVENYDDLISACGDACPNLKKLVEESNDFNLKYNRFKDGNYWGGPDAPLYGIADYYVDKYTYEKARLDKIQERNTWLARGDIYEGEGSPDLSNLDTFYNYLKTVKDKYKDVNGKPVTPLGLMNAGQDGVGAIDIFIGSFTGDISGLKKSGDTFVNLFEAPGYKEGLVYLSKLYRDKLLDQEMFTGTIDQWREKLINGNIAILPAWYWHTGTANATLQADHPDMMYKSIPAENIPKAEGITNPILNFGWQIGVGFGWRSSYISKSSSEEKKMAAVKFMDFMYSHEGQMLQWYGLPGDQFAPAEAWDPANLPKLQDKSMAVEPTEVRKAELKSAGADYAKTTGVEMWNFWNVQGYTDFTQGAGYGGRAPVDDIEKFSREQVNKLAKYDVQQARMGDILPLTLNNPDNSAINDALKQLKIKWYPKIVMSNSDADAAGNYDSMIVEMKNAGLDKLRDEFNKMYQGKMEPLMK